MADLIDRQALRSKMYHEAFEKDSDEQRWDSGCWIRYKMFERVVDRLPFAQPEIVRCKDCKHRDPEDKKCDSGHFIQWQLPRDDDWFCADGERRTDE